MKFFVSLASVLALAVSTARAQDGCYSSSYGAQGGCYGGNVGVASQYPVQAPLATAFCGQTQTQTTYHTVLVPTTVAVQQQVAVQQPVAVAAPAPCQQALAAPLSYAAPQTYAVPVAVVAVPQVSYGFAASHSVGFGVNQFRGVSAAHYGVSNQLVGVNRFVGVAPQITSGTGVVINAVDRRGNSVSAVGANNVRIQRGLLGRINGAQVDSRRGGLLGAIGL